MVTTNLALIAKNPLRRSLRLRWPAEGKRLQLILLKEGRSGASRNKGVGGGAVRRGIKHGPPQPSGLVRRCKRGNRNDWRDACALRTLGQRCIPVEGRL